MLEEILIEENPTILKYKGNTETTLLESIYSFMNCIYIYIYVVRVGYYVAYYNCWASSKPLAK